LCSLADAETVNGTPAAFEAGLLTLTLFTLMSDVRVTDTTEFLLAELLPGVGSLT